MLVVLWFLKSSGYSYYTQSYVLWSIYYKYKYKSCMSNNYNTALRKQVQTSYLRYQGAGV